MPQSSLTQPGYMPRLADRTLSEKLESYGAVCVEGTQWCGKTWLSMNHARSSIDISDPSDGFLNREIVRTNPGHAFKGETPRVIDEWQEVPSLWDAVKIKVDESPETGRFILTGSSTPTIKGIHHDGTGRIGTMRLRTMSLFESGDSDGAVSIRSLFEGADVLTEPTEVSFDDIASMIVRGGWPAMVGMGTDAAMDHCRDYVERVARRAGRLDGTIRDEGKVRMFLRSLARNESTVVSNATISRDIEEYEDETVSEQTVSAYRDVLSRMFLLEDQPAYMVNARSPVRVGKSPKRHLTDPSLAAAALGLGPERLSKERKTMGHLFEALCVRDLDVYSSVNGWRVYHYRDGKGREIDAIVERPDGSWGAFEIKTGTTGIEDGARNLGRMAKVFEDNGWPAPTFGCVLCGACPVAYRRSDGVYVVPVTRLRDRLLYHRSTVPRTWTCSSTPAGTSWRGRRPLQAACAPAPWTRWSDRSTSSARTGCSPAPYARTASGR